MFNYTLPDSGNVLTFKLLTHGDENKIDVELKGLKKIKFKITFETRQIMAIFMGNQVAVIAGTTTISTFVSSVSLSREIDPVEITTMSTSASQQFHNFIGGLESSTLAMELFNDWTLSTNSAP